MAAVGEDAKTALARVGLLKHHLHTHTAHHVLAALDGERNLHVFLVGLDARLGGGQSNHQHPNLINLNFISTSDVLLNFLQTRLCYVLRLCSTAVRLDTAVVLVRQISQPQVIVRLNIIQQHCIYQDNTCEALIPCR